jgi:hypothetical protein
MMMMDELYWLKKKDGDWMEDVDHVYISSIMDD